jgi:hypothetical protein
MTIGQKESLSFVNPHARLELMGSFAKGPSKKTIEVKWREACLAGDIL